MGGTALVVVVLMAIGVIFGIVRPSRIGWYLVFLLLLPIMLGVARQVFTFQGDPVMWVAGVIVLIVFLRVVFRRARGDR